LRTLVVSDLHLGAGPRRSVLEEPAAVAKLATAVAGSDRLVLLGDIVDLRERRSKDALAAASRVIPDLTSALGPRSELILVPGNHDHQFMARSELGDELRRLLARDGADVKVEYPGVWLREDVYAHHGHYLDLHTRTPAFERLAAGAMARFLKVRASEMVSAEDYERVLAPIYAWMYEITQTGGGEAEAGEGGASMRLLDRIRSGNPLEVVALQAGVRAVVAAVSRAGLGPLSGDLSDAQLRRASLIAYGDVLSVLGVNPSYALFGHTHRAGPLAGDDLGEWITPFGVQLMNTGSWVHELFVLEYSRENPYRAGFAVELDATGPPRLVNLLDD
jgi:predicted phosphodiesterase